MSEKLFEQTLIAMESGDFFEAEKNLRILRGVLSQKEESEDLAKVHFMLGMLFEKQGLLEEAVSSLQLSLNMRSSLLGPTHSATALTLKILCSIVSRVSGKEELAIELNRKSVALASELLGEDNKETILSRMKLSFCLVAAEEYDEAFDELLACVAKKSILDNEDVEGILGSLDALKSKVKRVDAIEVLNRLNE